ncbi:MAG: bifunctional precorrin-2 dehydrogenase/sirohydrochlorin ferrochelatase [Treponema sp.]|nr:bifunctional precorrin-2 dehydrogenase/sirohydrochlorin ferrochelatase [Treponema sp.]
MAFFPIFVSLGDCLVVGGGAVAHRKACQLLEFGANVTVVAREAGDEMKALAASNQKIRIVQKSFEEPDVTGMSLVVAATDDTACNRAVYSAAHCRQIPVNVVDVPELCDFYFPAIVRRGELVVAVGTGGKSPAFARSVKQKIDEVLPQDAGERLEKAALIRKTLLAAGKSPAHDAGYNEAVTL